jgi:hypothetical protein
MNHITIEAKEAWQINQINLKIQSRIKLEGMAKMAIAHIEREILGVLMESPFYFTIPLRKRLEFLKFFSQRSVYHRICEYNELPVSEKSNFAGAALIKP